MEIVPYSRAKIGESPYWDTDLQALLWVDIENRKVFKLKENKLFSFTLHQQVGCIVPTENPMQVLAALQDQYGFYNLRTKTYECLGYLEIELPENRFNDGICDPKGRFLFGSMCPSSISYPKGAVYQLDGIRCRKVLDSFYTVNGLAINPMGTTLYISDSHPKVQTIWAFDYDLSSGEISNRRIFFQTFNQKGRPDGAAVDEEGGYWICCVGGSQILRLLPDGTIDLSIKTPTQNPTKVAFGGPDLKTIYFTSKDGYVFYFPVAQKGMEVNRFRRAID